MNPVWIFLYIVQAEIPLHHSMAKYVRPEIKKVKIGSLAHIYDWKRNFESSEITFRRIFYELLGTLTPLVFVVADYNVIATSVVRYYGVATSSMYRLEGTMEIHNVSINEQLYHKLFARGVTQLGIKYVYLVRLRSRRDGWEGKCWHRGTGQLFTLLMAL